MKRTAWVVTFFVAGAVVAAGLVVYLLTFRAQGVVTREDSPQQATAPPPPPSASVAMDDLARVYRDLMRASIAFNAPHAMQFDETAHVDLFLSLTEPIDALQQALVNKGARYGFQIQTGPQMEVTLIPARKSAFEIVALGPAVQAIHPTERTRWSWTVTPLEAGKHELFLTFTALFELKGARGKRTFKTFEHSIRVEVTPWNRVKIFARNNWQWLWTVLLVPIVGYVVRKVRRRPPTFDG